ncbi:hypothetical protein ACMYZ5_04910 [Bacteroides sp. KG68]|uniref:hypothetical protein n=1 Tax=unclassified Bacteroides TaxID=2646097 RepID=UPI003D9875DD
MRAAVLKGSLLFCLIPLQTGAFKEYPPGRIQPLVFGKKQPPIPEFGDIMGVCCDFFVSLECLSLLKGYMALMNGMNLQR